MPFSYSQLVSFNGWGKKLLERNKYPGHNLRQYSNTKMGGQNGKGELQKTFLFKIFFEKINTKYYVCVKHYGWGC